MAKILTGKVISTAMNGVAIVEVTRKTPHPLYKKLLKRSKNFKVALNGNAVTVGDTVQIIETRPISKDMHFALLTPDAKQKTATKTAASDKKEPAKEKKKPTVKKEGKKATS